jgi:hypothetical protein
MLDVRATATAPDEQGPREIRLVGGPENGATWEKAGADETFADGDRFRVGKHVYVIDLAAGVGVCAGIE